LASALGDRDAADLTARARIRDAALRLFAEQVLPVLQRDAAFQGIIDPVAAQTQAGDERLFAPA